MPTPARCRHLLALALIVLAALAAAPATAGARVALIATGTPDVAVLDVATGQVIRRIPLPGPTTAVAISPDGRTAFAAGGGVVVALDLRDPATITTQVAAAAPAAAPGAIAASMDPPGAHAAATPAPQTVAGGEPVTALAVSPGSARVYAVAGRRLVVLDARTLQPSGSVDLRGPALALAISRDGSLAAVPLATGKVAMVALGVPKLLRRVKVHAAAGATFAAGRAWITTTGGRLRTIPAGARTATKGIKIGKGAGGGVAASPDGTQLAIGAAPHGAKAAIVDLATLDVHAFKSAAGPGIPAWSPDGSRVYLADRGARTLSLASPYAHHRLGTVALPAGLAALGVAVQPGLALVLGTDAPDVLLGTRGPDLLEGLGGDDRLAGGRDNDLLHGGDGND
ncbi:MAG: Cytochrome heme domain, partial [Baekduia sp.]|nr:Cytochrome heme domain [Baekduia sp.]